MQQRDAAAQAKRRWALGGVSFSVSQEFIALAWRSQVRSALGGYY
jgi:hypothetical protein